jgi:hypothetical protein
VDLGEIPEDVAGTFVDGLHRFEIEETVVVGDEETHTRLLELAVHDLLEIIRAGILEEE